MGQFFVVGAQMTGSLEQTTQIILDISCVTAHVVYASPSKTIQKFGFLFFICAFKEKCESWVSVCDCELGYLRGEGANSKHRFVYDVLPPTTAVIGYAIAANGTVFCCWCSNDRKFGTDNSDYIRHFLCNCPRCVLQHK